MPKSQPSSSRARSARPPLLEVGDYSLSVSEGRERGVPGAVFLRHKEQYTISLGNHGYYSCDAAVFIDGTPVGTWRLKPGQTAIIERPCNSTARFTFFVDGTVEAAIASGSDKSQNGTLKVAFTPGITRQEVGDIGKLNPRRKEPERDGLMLYAGPVHDRPLSGVTGLTGTSDQKFNIATQDLDFIPSAAKTLSFRLLADIPQTRSGPGALLRRLLKSKRVVVVACFVAAAGLAAYFWRDRSGPELVASAEVAEYEGKTVVVESVLTEARSYKDVVYLNFGGKYPNQEFAVMLSSRLALRIADALAKRGQNFKSVEGAGIWRIKGPVRRQKSGITIEPSDATDIVWRSE